MAFCILQKDRFWVFEAVLSFCRLPVSWICQLPPQFHPAKSSSSFLSCCSVLLHPFLPWPVMNCAGEEGGSERKSEGSGNIHPERSLLNKKNLWAVVPVPNTTDGHLSSFVIVWVACGALVWVQPNYYRLQNGAFKKKKSLFISVWSW